MNPRFTNPWHAPLLRSSGEEVYKATLRLPKRVNAFFNGVHGGPEGTLQTTVNLLLYAFHERLDRNGITYFDPAAYESAVLDSCAAILYCDDGTLRSAPPLPQPSDQAPPRNDPRGAASVVSTAKGGPVSPANGRRGKGKGKEGQG